MQYDQIERIIDEKDLATLCISNNMTPDQVVKKLIQLRNDCQIWSTVHPEYGTLRSVDKLSYNNSYVVSVEYDAKPDSRGNSIRKCKTGFIYDNGETLARINQLVDKRCCFYVGYNKNDKDGSVFRNLADIEQA